MRGGGKQVHPVSGALQVGVTLDLLAEDALGEDGQVVRLVLVVAVMGRAVHQHLADDLASLPVAVERVDECGHADPPLFEDVRADAREGVRDGANRNARHRGDLVVRAAGVPVEAALDAVVDERGGERHRAPARVDAAHDVVVLDLLVGEVGDLRAERGHHLFEGREGARIAGSRPELFAGQTVHAVVEGQLEAFRQVEVPAGRHAILAVAERGDAPVEAARSGVSQRLAAVHHPQHQHVRIEHRRHAHALAKQLTAAQQEGWRRLGADLRGQPGLRQPHVLQRRQAHERQLVGRVATVPREPADVQVLKVRVRAARLRLARVLRQGDLVELQPEEVEEFLGLVERQVARVYAAPETGIDGTGRSGRVRTRDRRSRG